MILLLNENERNIWREVQNPAPEILSVNNLSIKNLQVRWTGLFQNTSSTALIPGRDNVRIGLKSVKTEQ